MTGSCFFSLIIDRTHIVLSFLHLKRVSFLQSRRNQVEISSHSKALVEELSKKNGVIELTTTFCSPDSFQFFLKHITLCGKLQIRYNLRMNPYL